jgi:hypothetical protein
LNPEAAAAVLFNPEAAFVLANPEATLLANLEAALLLKLEPGTWRTWKPHWCCFNLPHFGNRTVCSSSQAGLASNAASGLAILKCIKMRLPDWPVTRLPDVFLVRPNAARQLKT